MGTEEEQWVLKVHTIVGAFLSLLASLYMSHSCRQRLVQQKDQARVCNYLGTNGELALQEDRIVPSHTTLVVPLITTKVYDTKGQHMVTAEVKELPRYLGDGRVEVLTTVQIVRK